MLVAEQTHNFIPTLNPHSLSLANVVQTPAEFTPGLVAEQWEYERRGLQGLGLGCTGSCGGCSGMGACPYGLGGLGLDIESALTGATIPLILGGGLLLYWMIAGSPARERRAALRGAKAEYQAKVRKIKGTHSRLYHRRGSGSGFVPSGKKWAKGAWRDEDYEE